MYYRAGVALDAGGEESMFYCYRNLLAAVIGALMVILYQHFFAQQPIIATIDLKAITNEQMLQAQGLDKKEAEEKGKQFGIKLKNSLDDMVNEFNVILMIKPAILQGAPDLTAELKRRLEN